MSSKHARYAAARWGQLTWNAFDEQTQQWRDAVQLSANAYTYDYGGYRLTNTITYPDTSSRTEAYGYDALSRLIGVGYENDATADAWWVYDAVGNRLWDLPAMTSAAVYNNANMLTSYDGQNYTNDLNGNTLTGGGRTNVWDSQNRLVQTTFGGTTTGFTYGPDGLRRTATTGGVTTQYILDGQNVVQEMSPSGVVSYLWGPRGPEARIDPAGNTLWFLYDGHGNVVAEAGEPDQYGNPIKGMRNYGPWGGSTQSGTLESSIAYCGALGHPTDPTGLIYMRARYYDPFLGRFISEDPAKDGSNWYLYAAGNPVGMVDSSGRESLAETVFSMGMQGGLMSMDQLFIWNALQGKSTGFAELSKEFAKGFVMSALLPHADADMVYKAVLGSLRNQGAGSGIKSAAFYVAVHFHVFNEVMDALLEDQFGHLVEGM